MHDGGSGTDESGLVHRGLALFPAILTGGNVEAYLSDPAYCPDATDKFLLPNGANGSLNYYNFFIHEFWRFVFVQQEVARYAETFVQFPPMQRGASFNMEAVKAQVEAAVEKARAGRN